MATDAQIALLVRGLAAPGAALYPRGMDGAALWAPYARAKEAVERYPGDPQEPGCETDLIRHDAGAARLDFFLIDTELPSRCQRFASRACPRMAPMGHEPAQETCNYWDYPRMAGLAPGLELYPEWQRFDCHKFYPLFQLHLVGEELARALGCQAFFTLLSPRPGDARQLAAYAALASRPGAFSWRMLS